jgi:hypothetical protein
LKGPVAQAADGFDTLFERIQRELASYNGVSIIQGDIEEISLRDFHEAGPQRKENKQSITRQELWKKQYREAPYLRSLSDKAVLEYGVRAIETLTPYFLKNGPRVPVEELEEMMVA